MTHEEAISFMQNCREHAANKGLYSKRYIGAYDLAIEALEKQIVKKPNELKPCPFCGAKPKIKYWANNALMALDARLRIVCPHGHAHIEVAHAFDGTFEGDFDAIVEMKEQATKIWNERSAHEAQT